MPFITSVEELAHRKSIMEGLEVALEVKYGPAGSALLPEIQQITDVEKLKSILQAIRTVATPEELRKLWA